MATHVAPTFVGSTTTSNNNVANANLVSAIPNGVVEGDLLIVLVGTNQASVATPDGWTLEGSVVRTGTSVFNVYSKRAGANEQPTTFVASVAHAGHLLTTVAYRNAGNTGDFVSAIGTTNNPVTMPTVTPSFDNSVILYANTNATTGALPNPSVTWSSAATERSDFAQDYSSSGTNARMGMSTAEVLQAAPGSSASVTATMSSVASGSSARIALVIRPVTKVPRLVNRVDSGVANTTMTQASIPLPSGVQAGDVVIVAFSWTRSAATATAPTYPPAPWSTCGTVMASTSATGAWIGWTTYDPSMGSSLVIPFNVSAQFGWQATAYAFRNADPSKLLMSNVSVPATNSTTTVLPAIAGVPEESYILVLGTNFQTVATVTATFTANLNRDLQANKQGGTSRFAYLATAVDVMVDAGSYATKNITWSTTNSPRLGVLVAIPPLLALPGSFWPFFS